MQIGSNTDRCKSLRVHNENMINVEEITYLGNIISSDERNTKNIKDRMSRGMSLSCQICDILCWHIVLLNFIEGIFG